MQKPALVIAAVVLATAVAAAQGYAPLPARPTPPPPPPSPPAAGKTAYMKNGCWLCHGQEGQGGAAGPRLGPRPMPLPAFRAYVRRPSGDMPPYSEKVLSENDVRAMHAFLTALPTPAAVSAIPLLRP